MIGEVAERLRPLVVLVAFLSIIGYSIAYLAVAFTNDATKWWWWFVPIYGSIRIFEASVAWGLFHVGILPATWIAGAAISAAEGGAVLPRPSRSRDWASPADPALVALAEDTFARTAARFREIYTGPDNPVAVDGPQKNDLDVALRVMVDGLGYVIDPDDPTSARLWSLGAGGYVWRLAETHNAHHADAQIREQVVECMSHPEERFLMLARAAIRCVDHAVPLGFNSPGGLISGKQFLEAGFRRVFAEITGESEEPTLDDRAAFMFGVALNDCERVYDSYWAVKPATQFMNRLHDRLVETGIEAVTRPDVSETTSIDLSGANTTDDDLAQLRQMPELEELDLSGSSITDEGLAHLSDLHALERVDLSDSEVAGPGLAYLGGKPINYLNLSGSRLTDEGLARFPELSKLDHLDLSDTSITDKGLYHLANLPALLWLELLNTAVEGQGLAHLAGSPITYVNLAGSEITDKGLQHLAELKRLQDLRLNETAITDAGLAPLLDVATLEELNLSDTAVTDAGVMKLLEHPRLRIVEAHNTRVSRDAVDAWRERKRLLRTDSERMDPGLKVEMDQQEADRLFEEATQRFRDLYTSKENPTVGNDRSIALELMIQGFGYKNDAADPRCRELWSLGSAGYAWRLAEGAGTGHGKEQIREAVAAGLEDETRLRPDRGFLAVFHELSERETRLRRPFALVRAALAIIDRGAPIGLESPGGFQYGRVFLRRGCDYTVEFVSDPAVDLPQEEREAAFYFGLALHDAEPWVDELRAEAT